MRVKCHDEVVKLLAEKAEWERIRTKTGVYYAEFVLVYNKKEESVRKMFMTTRFSQFTPSADEFYVICDSVEEFYDKIKDL